MEKMRVQDLQGRKPLIITIGDVTKETHWGDTLPEKLIGLTFYVQRTGSHSVQPLLPFGQWSYNIYDEHIEEMWSPEIDREAFDAKEKAMMPVDHKGDKIWYKNGLLHSYNDKPAKILKGGTRFWYKHGKQHRDNGRPAEIYSDGEKRWYLDGKKCTTEELKALAEKFPEEFI